MPIDETGFQIVVFPPRENLNKTKTRRTKTIRITFTSNKFCTKHLFLSFPTCTYKHKFMYKPIFRLHNIETKY